MQPTNLHQNQYIIIFQQNTHIITMKPSFPTFTINHPYQNIQKPTKISVSQSNVAASQCFSTFNPSIKFVKSQPTNSTFQQSQQSINSHTLSHVYNNDLSTSRAVSIIESISPSSAPLPSSYTSEKAPKTSLINKFEAPVRHSSPPSLPHTYTTPEMHESYKDLLQQNIKLKRIINQEYLPLKSMYNKLKQQSEDREYLISQLEWKVKQLAKEMKRQRNN